MPCVQILTVLCMYFVSESKMFVIIYIYALRYKIIIFVKMIALRSDVGNMFYPKSQSD